MNYTKCSAAVVVCLAFFIHCEMACADDAPGTYDVTNAVRQAVQGDVLEVPANNDIWGDPAPAQLKKLKVEYTLNGTAKSKAVMEGSMLSIHPPKGTKLAITKAVYGELPNERKVDVTRALNEAIQSDKISLPVNNESLRADPAPGSGKVLEISYTVGGKPFKTSVGEGGTLTLPSSKDGNGALVIVEAIYGAS